MKILVCALTSSDGYRLHRLIHSVKENIGHKIEWQGLVLCNTLSKSYPDQARTIAEFEEWDFYQTASNGMPGKGKNSALYTFNKYYTDFDYLLLLDGDDFLYREALSQIERVITQTRCDVLGLQTNDILDRVVYDGVAKVNLTDLQNPVYLYSWFSQQPNIYSMPEQYHRVVRTSKLGSHSTPDRIILFSHMAASLLKCSEELPVYEDYILSLNAQAEYLKGHLKYFNTSSNCIYMYDKTGETSTCKEYNKKVNGDWSTHDDLFRQEVSSLEPVLKDFHASEVPFIFIPNNIKDVVGHKIDQALYYLNFTSSLIPQPAIYARPKTTLTAVF